MNQTLRTATLILITGLIVLSLSSLVKSAGPPVPPMTISGYVTIQKTDRTNITAPAGLNVYAKQNTTVFSNVTGSMPTNAQGYYIIAVTGPSDGTPIDLWVQGINVTRLTFNQSGSIDETNGGNLTVVDTTAPTIQVLSPPANVPSNQAVWVNATLSDDLEINATSIMVTLNQTQLAWTFDNVTGLLFSQTGVLAQGRYVANITVADMAGNIGSNATTFMVGPDTTPPNISIPYQNPPGKLVDPNVTLNVPQGSSVDVSVNVTDVESGVKQAILSYNDGSGWLNLTMSAIGNQYTATIPVQPNGTAVTYYVAATDNANNTARTPTDQLYYEFYVIPEFNFEVLLLALAFATTLATAISRSKKLAWAPQPK